LSLSVRLCALLALALAVIVVAGCGETVIDSTKTEEQLQSNQEKETGEKVKEVDCPSHVEVEVGKTFECTIVGEKNKKSVALLKIRNNDADIDLVSVKPSGQ
jgi:uncharacterized lipoprotein